MLDLMPDEEILAVVNRVRSRMGWEELPALPKSDPDSTCSCIFGRSWAMQVVPRGRTAVDRNKVYGQGHYGLYRKVTFSSRAKGPNGNLLDAIAAELSGRIIYEEQYNYCGPSVEIDGEHPVMVWMWHFDHKNLIDLIDVNAPDPVDKGDSIGKPVWEKASHYQEAS